MICGCVFWIHIFLWFNYFKLEYYPTLLRSTLPQAAHPAWADLKDGGPAVSDIDLKMAKRRSKIVYAPKSRRRSSGTDRSQSASSYEQDTKETSRRNKRSGAKNEAAEAPSSNLSSNVENSQQHSKVQCQIKHVNWGFLFAIFGYIKSASLIHSLIWQSTVVHVSQSCML